MEQKNVIEQLIEQKRAEMRKPQGQSKIDVIYEQIRTIASEMKFETEPMCKEVDCKRLYASIDSDFVTLLYRQILEREPDEEGYFNNLAMLTNKQCSREQMIYAFANSEEGRQNNIKLLGLKNEITKEKIKRMILRIPLLGYIMRWIVCFVLLPKKISVVTPLYNSLQLQNLHLKNMCESNKNQMEFLQKSYSVLESQYRDLTRKYSELVAQNVNDTEEQAKMVIKR